MSIGQVATTAWWREVLEAGFRQVVQVVLPVLVVVAGTGGVDRDAALTAAVAAGVAFTLVVLRRLVGAVPPDDAGQPVRVFYRALSAFAGSLAGVLSAEALDLAALDFGNVLTAAVASAGVAVLHGVLDPGRVRRPRRDRVTWPRRVLAATVIVAGWLLFGLGVVVFATLVALLVAGTVR